MSEDVTNGTTAVALEALPETPEAPKPAEPEAPHAPPPAAPVLTYNVLPLSSIEASGSLFHFRRPTEAKIKALAESIRNEGQLNPLVVRPKGGRFELVAGFRRYAALLHNAEQDGVDPSSALAKVNVMPEGTSDDAALKVALAENVQRKTFDPIEKAIAAIRMKVELGKTYEEIRELLGVSATHLDRFRAIIEGPEEVQRAVRSGSVSLSHAVALASTKDAEARSALLERATLGRQLKSGAIAAVQAGETEVDPLADIEPEVRKLMSLRSTADAERPIRFSVRLRSVEEAKKIARYVSRYAV